MSSDEEDQFRGIRRYRVLPKSWRAPELQPWLRVFDAVHRKKRVAPFEPGRGANPRLRFAAGTEVPRQVRNVVKGLPKAAYNPAWLATLSVLERKRLKVREEEADFTHSAEMLL